MEALLREVSMITTDVDKICVFETQVDPARLFCVLLKTQIYKSCVASLTITELFFIEILRSQIVLRAALNSKNQHHNIYCIFWCSRDMNQYRY